MNCRYLFVSYNTDRAHKHPTRYA